MQPRQANIAHNTSAQCECSIWPFWAHTLHISHFSYELRVVELLPRLIETTVVVQRICCSVCQQLRAQIRNDESTISSHTHIHTHIKSHCHSHYALKGLVAKFNFLHLNGFAANIHNCCNILWHPLACTIAGIACPSSPARPCASTKPLDVTKCFVRPTALTHVQSISTMGNQFPSPFHIANDYSMGIFSFHKLL